MANNGLITIESSDSGDWYAQLELVEDSIKVETRRRTYAVLTSNIYVRTLWQSRQIRTKKYEGTIRDADPDAAELPAPTYLAGNSKVILNPENLPEGHGVGQWHLIDVQYTKSLETPLSRRYTVTWESYVTAWDTDESDSGSM